MHTDLQLVAMRLREIMHMLDERDQVWAAAAVSDAIEELDPTPDMLPDDEDTIH
jgi:hypothetical protein